MRLQTILALTDFSAQAEHGLERAAMLAATHNARLRILYGAETPNPKFVDSFARLEQRARQLARRHGVQVVAVNQAHQANPANQEPQRQRSRGQAFEDDGFFEFLMRAPKVEGFAELIGERHSIKDISPLGE